jgi:hypothetical protein
MNLAGRKNVLGGPHAARGPLVGHPWSRQCRILNTLEPYRPHAPLQDTRRGHVQRTKEMIKPRRSVQWGNRERSKTWGGGADWGLLDEHWNSVQSLEIRQKNKKQIPYTCHANFITKWYVTKQNVWIAKHESLVGEALNATTLQQLPSKWKA